jgi:hypothetical protein
MDKGIKSKVLVKDNLACSRLRSKVDLDPAANLIHQKVGQSRQMAFLNDKLWSRDPRKGHIRGNRIEN